MPISDAHYILSDFDYMQIVKVQSALYKEMTK